MDRLLDPRQAKTKAIQAEIRKEWAALEAFYRDKQRAPYPSTPRLKFLLKSAVRDFHRRSSDDPTRFKVTYRPHAAYPIRLKYVVSNFGNIRLIPPTRYKLTRQAMGV